MSGQLLDRRPPTLTLLVLVAAAALGVVAVTARCAPARPAVSLRGVQYPTARLHDAALHWWRRTHRRTVEPLGPPIEDIAANLRRLRGWLDRYDDPMPIPGKATKVAAASSAYDRVLCDACRALEVAQSLAETSGIEREAERLRIEAALQDAGLVLRNRPSHHPGG